MITTADCEFHARGARDRTWTETLYLAFSVPEKAIFGNFYILARPDQGVAISTVAVSRGWCHRPYEVDFCDAQMHLPCPESFRDFRLENGLAVQAASPGSYRVQYKGALEGCEFDLHFQAIHDVFDPHTSRDPGNAATRDPRMGPEWMSGHWEVKGKTTGRLHLRGKDHEVSCFDGMNRSWGPRPEIGKRAVAWVSLNFGDSLAFHVAALTRISGARVIYESLSFGFVVEDGHTVRLSEARIVASHRELMPERATLDLRDERGKCWKIEAHAVGGHPCYNFNPCHASFRSLMRLNIENRLGWGTIANIFGLDYLGNHCSPSGMAAQHVDGIAGQRDD